MFHNTSSLPQVRTLKTTAPEVIFPVRTLAIMELIVSEIPHEAGWLGSVTNIGNAYIIDDVFVPEQQANAGTCELPGNSILNLVELLEKEGKGEKANRLRFWGHSHHTMGISPSTQDEEMAEKLTKDCQSYFIRAICNKAGEMSVTFYDLARGISILNIPWYIDDGVDRRLIETEYKPIIKNNIKPFMSTSSFSENFDQYNNFYFERNKYAPSRRKSRRSILVDGESDASKLLKTT